MAASSHLNARPLARRNETEMDFWNFPTEKGFSNCNQRVLDEWIRSIPAPSCQRSQLRSEWEWVQARRPYYDLYPAIIPLLKKVDLWDVPVDKVVPPLPQLVIRLPKSEHSLHFDTNGARHWLQSVLFGEASIGGRKAIHLAIDHGEVDGEGRPILFCRHWIREKELSVQQVFEEFKPCSDGGITVPTEFLADVATVLASICMLADDADLIQPDVLSKDRSSFANTRDLKYVERAHRRGKRAWTIGKAVEKIPHYRRSHLAKFWVGPGRKTPVLRFRSGSIVRLTKASAVPTGYLDDCQSNSLGA